MKRRDLSPARIEFIRRAAVAAAMRSGRFQASGTARLLVLRKRDVMIAYRTPFNPLPPLSEMAKFLAAREGKTAHLQPYGIDIWQLDIGKVMNSAGVTAAMRSPISIVRATGKISWEPRATRRDSSAISDAAAKWACRRRDSGNNVAERRRGRRPHTFVCSEIYGRVDVIPLLSR